MFILNTTIDVNWLFPATVQVYTYTDFDVIVRKPDGTSSYNESAILEQDFIAPTHNTTGGVTYKFTPDEIGVWLVILTIGTQDSSDIYYEYYLRISEADNHIHQQVTV